MEDGEVFPMRIGIARDQIEDGGVEQLQHIDCGPGRDVPQQCEAILECCPALAGSGRLAGCQRRWN